MQPFEDAEVSITIEASSDDKVLIISVAARMAGMHPQTLRQYDRLGLVQPGRAAGGGQPDVRAHRARGPRLGRGRGRAERKKQDKEK